MKKDRTKPTATHHELVHLMYGLSEMARKHPNDTIANAMAEFSDRLARMLAAGKVVLKDTDKALLQYYHKNKG